MKILMIGDVFARLGREAIKNELRNIREKENIDFVIANAENATHCKGIILKHYNELMSFGVDFFTMGNHTWNKNDIFDILQSKNNIIRPYNISKESSLSEFGEGTTVVKIKGFNVRITNLLGSSVFFKEKVNNPFHALDEIIAKDKSDFHIIDFHAETTSEKNALFYDFKGKVTAICGTHSHVQTADERIRSNTAYITDIGMTGPSEGIIGAFGTPIVEKMRFPETIEGFKLEQQDGGYQFCAVIIDIDEKQKIPTSIKRIYIYGPNEPQN